jgi:hypothetical protein
MQRTLAPQEVVGKICKNICTSEKPLKSTRHLTPPPGSKRPTPTSDSDSIFGRSNYFSTPSSYGIAYATLSVCLLKFVTDALHANLLKEIHMKTTDNVIHLRDKQPKERLVKRGALVAFKAIRAIASQAKEVPGQLSQSLTDLREAWEQSRPNA